MFLANPPRSRRWRRIGTNLVLLIAAALAGSWFAESASASCGHYVRRLGPGFVPAKPVAITGTSRTDMNDDFSFSRIPSRCRGPECRDRAPQAPEPLAPANPSRVHRTQDEPIGSAAAAIRFLPASGEFLALFAEQPRSGFPPSLDRPPKN
jgi:hypothetical protein